jgi:hypothetical protein
MLTKLCIVLGHRRHKSRARPHLETWRSECVRCGVPMVRSAPGLWTPAPMLHESIRSTAPASKRGGSSSSVPNHPRPPRAERLTVESLAELPAARRSAAFSANNGLAPSDREHYQARSAECRRLAEAASDHAVKLIHLDMATRYDILARRAGEPRLQLHAVK